MSNFTWGHLLVEYVTTCDAASFFNPQPPHQRRLRQPPPHVTQRQTHHHTMASNPGHPTTTAPGWPTLINGYRGWRRPQATTHTIQKRAPTTHQCLPATRISHYTSREWRLPTTTQNGPDHPQEVLVMPHIFLPDSGHSGGFRCHSSGICQPKFHSCHGIFIFR